MKIKPKGKIYSINEGYANLWEEPVKKFVESRKVKTEILHDCLIRQALKYDSLSGLFSNIFGIKIVYAIVL